MLRPILLLALAGCGGAPEEADQLAATFTADLDELFSQMVTVTDAGSCVEGVGTCTWCSTVEGAVNGSFEISAESLPCGGERVWDESSASYEVTGGGLSGTWQSSSSDVWEISAVGSRDASVAVTGRRAATLDASWALDELHLVLVDGAPDDWDAEMTYASFAGHGWTVEVDGDGSLFTATVYRDDDVTCTIERSFDGVAVDCHEGG